MEMVNYVVRRIEQQANISLAAGQAKYRAYFVKIHIYERYRAEVEVMKWAMIMQNLVV